MSSALSSKPLNIQSEDHQMHMIIGFIDIELVKMLLEKGINIKKYICDIQSMQEVSRRHAESLEGKKMNLLHSPRKLVSVYSTFPFVLSPLRCTKRLMY